MGAQVEFNVICTMVHGQLHWPVLGSVRDERSVKNFWQNAQRKKTQHECVP